MSPGGPGDGVQGRSCQHSPTLVLCCASPGPGTRVLLGCTPQKSSKARKGVTEEVMHAHPRSRTHTFTLSPPRRLSEGCTEQTCQCFQGERCTNGASSSSSPHVHRIHYGKPQEVRGTTGTAWGGSERSLFSWKRQGEMARQMSS